MAVWTAVLLAVWLLPADARAADPTGAAKVLNADGQASVLRDNNFWALFPGHIVQVGETIVTGGDGFIELEVSDGSSFFVYPNSQVVFRRNPGSLRDLLDLFLGRIKVSIQTLGGQPSHYRVFTPTAVISVRGTAFDVSVDQDETTLIVVDEGLVGVTHRLLPSRDEVSVGAGQSLVVYRNSPLAKARVDKIKAARIAGNVARTAAYIWSRIGRRSAGPSAGGSPGGAPGGGPPLPGDTPAPAPPPPPAPK